MAVNIKLTKISKSNGDLADWKCSRFFRVSVNGQRVAELDIDSANFNDPQFQKDLYSLVNAVYVKGVVDGVGHMTRSET